ncbi:MAG: tyrosine-type recombinase/integrase [Oscillospiraceae bacterium]|nr:tyrosine-type recombinase/integrase [Oscillospiraceae bacterium]
MRRKYPRLPNGYGSIRFLGAARSRPYAVQPPEKDSAQQKVLCYVSDWMIGFAVLTAWHAGTYYPGLEDEIYKRTRSNINGNNPEELCKRMIRDYSRMNHRRSGCTVGEIYELFMDWKYGESAARLLSPESRAATEAAFELLRPYHSRLMDDITIHEWQNRMNRLGKQYSRSTVRNAVGLVKNLYSYAVPRELCRKDFGRYVVMPRTRPEQHYEPFTDEELSVLWRSREDPVVKMILIMCYSGFRVSAYIQADFETNLEEGYFRGGVKTETGRNRTVPIHSAIMPLVKSVCEDGHTVWFTGKSISQFRRDMKTTLRRLGLKEKTPHSCRHTFSRLCESYGAREADRKRMLGHSFGNDITNGVYGHRTLEELRAEIEKIKAPDGSSQ